MGSLKGLDRFKIKTFALVLALAVTSAFVFQTQPAEAHCDSVSGPVVGAAKAALEKGDVKLVLPYVQVDAEAELTAAFNQAVRVRKIGGEAQKLAETHFFETAVRLHRQGEGAAYTGLKYESEFGPALEAADEALRSNSAKTVNKVLKDAVDAGLAEKFEAVQEAREKAEKLGTVEAQRERAEAELLFETYVLGLYNTALGHDPHAEGRAPGETAHAPEK